MPNSEMLRVLRLLPFISNLARHRVQQLADMCAQAVYDKGTVICKQGEYQPDEQFYILIKGDVALTRPQGMYHWLCFSIQCSSVLRFGLFMYFCVDAYVYVLVHVCIR